MIAVIFADGSQLGFQLCFLNKKTIAKLDFYLMLCYLIDLQYIILQ